MHGLKSDGSKRRIAGIGLTIPLIFIVNIAMPKIAFLTAGGLAPCLSSAIGALIEQYAKICPDAELVGYLNGYQGLLLGKSVAFPADVMEKAHLLHHFGGSPIGNSRVKLTNIKDCVKRGR